MLEVVSRPQADDPRLLRDMLARARALASQHAVPSVLVGFAAREGDALFPDFVAYVESELRVEDAIFRLTRERALLFLADVGGEQARAVVERLLGGFEREFPAREILGVQVRYLEVAPGGAELLVKQVLPAVFVHDDDAEA
jgi:GGDEF domain-containing protein